MNLLPKKVASCIPPLYSTENIPTEDKMLQTKFFDPCGRGTWYAVEFDGEDMFFGYVVSPPGKDCDEWGYFSLSELASIKNRFGLKIERDKFFIPVKFEKMFGSDY